MGAIQQLVAGIKQGASLDPDAQAFLTATGIVDATITSAINTLCIDLKGYSIWTKCNAIYPFVGGTATTHKYNLKDPRDLDAAFRIVWSGTITHDANGVTGNGTTGFGDTKLNCSTVQTINDMHLSLYNRTASPNRCDMGIDDGTSACTLFPDDGAGAGHNASFVCVKAADQVLTASAGATKFWLGTRTSSTSITMYRSAVSQASSVTPATGSKPNFTHYVCAQNQGGFGTGNYSNANYAFASIGAGLSSTEVGNFNTAVVAFQTTLSRQV